MSPAFRRLAGVGVGVLLIGSLARCDDDNPLGPSFDRSVDPQLAEQGREIFRFDTFGNEVFWTDTV
jgi:hypothetical protein